eukprot:2559057-Rhodomonas_salina.2
MLFCLWRGTGAREAMRGDSKGRLPALSGGSRGGGCELVARRPGRHEAGLQSRPPATHLAVFAPGSGGDEPEPRVAEVLAHERLRVRASDPRASRHEHCLVHRRQRRVEGGPVACIPHARTAPGPQVCAGPQGPGMGAPRVGCGLDGLCDGRKRGCREVGADSHRRPGL